MKSSDKILYFLAFLLERKLACPYKDHRDCYLPGKKEVLCKAVMHAITGHDLFETGGS